MRLLLTVSNSYPKIDTTRPSSKVFGTLEGVEIPSTIKELKKDEDRKDAKRTQQKNTSPIDKVFKTLDNSESAAQEIETTKDNAAEKIAITAEESLEMKEENSSLEIETESVIRKGNKVKYQIFFYKNIKSFKYFYRWKVTKFPFSEETSENEADSVK